MKKVCIDIDDVIFKTASHILETLGLFFNEQYSINSLSIYDIEECLKLPSDIVTDAIDIAVSNEYPELEKDSRKTIKWLSQFYDITLLTSRNGSEYLDCTLDALANRDIIYNSLRFGKDKVSFINSMSIEVFIEDNPEYIKDVVDTCNTTVLVYDKPWNKQFKESQYLHRVYNWQEVKEWFMIKLGG